LHKLRSEAGEPAALDAALNSHSGTSTTLYFIT